METLEWLFKMRDGVSGPAKSATGSVSEMVQTFHAGIASLQILGQAAMGAGQMIGKALAPAISKEKTLGAFETILGTAQQARDVYQEAVKFAAATPFETRDVVQAYKQALVGGFKEDEVKIAIGIVGDATSMGENAGEALQRVFFQLNQIRGKNKLTMEDLIPIQEATSLKLPEFYANLAKMGGVEAAKIPDIISKGAIDGEVATYALLQTLQSQFGGNMEKASKQIEGLWSTLISYPDQYMSSLADTKGYKLVSESLSRITAQFDPLSEQGKTFNETIKDIGNNILSGVAVGIDYAAAGVVGFVDGLMLALGPIDEAFGPASQDDLEKFSRNMAAIGNATGAAVKGILAISDAIGTMTKTLGDLGDWLTDHPFVARLVYAGLGAIGGTAVGGPIGTVLGGIAGFTLPDVMEGAAGPNQAVFGERIGANPLSTQAALVAARNEADIQAGMASTGIGYAGIAEDMAAGYGMGANGYDAGMEFGQGAIDGTNEALGIHSPSKVYEEAGDYSAQGYARGVSNGTSAMADATSAMASSAAPIMISLSMPVTVNGGGQAFIDQVEPLLYGMLERASMALGRNR